MTIYRPILAAFWGDLCRGGCWRALRRDQVLALAATLITASNQLILPDFGLGKDVLVWLILLPLLLGGIAAISAKHTVRNVLEKIK